MRRVLNYLREVEWFAVAGVFLLALAAALALVLFVVGLPLLAPLTVVLALAGLGFIQIGLRS